MSQTFGAFSVNAIPKCYPLDLPALRSTTRASALLLASTRWTLMFLPTASWRFTTIVAPCRLMSSRVPRCPKRELEYAQRFFRCVEGFC